MEILDKNEVIQRLQKEVLSVQRRKKLSRNKPDANLGAIELAFPDKVFPTGAVHEFISYSAEDKAATNGFISCLLGKFLKQSGMCIWVVNKRTVFPPALKLFGIDPGQIVFVDVARRNDMLWVIEEALKCEALAAVIGELGELSFTESRRLQLAVESSHVTGFIHRYCPKTENIVACVTRWKIKTITSLTNDGLPGVGFPLWNVQLDKVRNGRPGSWTIEWSSGNFHYIERSILPVRRHVIKRKTG